MARLGIVDDNRSAADAMCRLVAPPHSLVGVAASVDEASGLLARDPEVLLLDILLHGVNGLSAIPAFRRSFPRTSIVVVSRCDTREVAQLARSLGASGFVSKRAPREVLLEGITKAASGEWFADPRTQISSLSALSQEAAVLASLTARERDVVALLGRGMTNAEIGAILGLSERGVHFHRTNIRRRLALQTDAELIRLGVLSCIDGLDVQ